MSSLENHISQRVRTRRRLSFGQAPRWRAGRAGRGYFRSRQFQSLTVSEFVHYDTPHYLNVQPRPSPTTTRDPIIMDDVIIIGGSFAGLAGALQLGRARRKGTVLDNGPTRNRFARHSPG